MGEPTELQEFVFWLEAECLEGEWRLNAYSKIVELLRNLNWDQPRNQTAQLQYQAIHSIREMLLKHTVTVVKCFTKLTDALPMSGRFYIPTDDARAILKAGLDHDDETVCENARQARENLLRRGFFSVLD